MKYAASMLLLLAAGLAVAPPARGEVRRTDRSPPSGRVYVRLGDWARANQFAVRAGDSQRVLELSNRWTRLAFNLNPRQDLRKAWINGVQIWLAFPLLYQNGSASISQIDLEQTLKPVLSSGAGRAGAKIKTICLDPGHGGRDPGFRVGGNEEQKYTLLLAQEVREQLKRAGFNVVLTRTADVFVERGERPQLAKRHGADLFVSLHFNAFPASTDVNGVEVYCCTPAGATSFNSGGEGSTRWVTGNRNDDKNMRLAYEMQRSLTRSLPSVDRGVKRARFDVLAKATMPAILIEGGFMSHPAEAKRIFDPAYRRQMARAIVDGIVTYKRLTKG